MLKLSTKRRTLDFELDGKACSIPAELDMDEMEAMGKAIKAAHGSGEDDFAKGIEYLKWFAAYASRYVPEVEHLSSDAISKLASAWKDVRDEAAGAAEGE